MNMTNVNNSETWTPERRAEQSELIKESMKQFEGNEANIAIAEGKIPGLDIKVGHRPCKLNPRVKKIILEGLRLGNYFSTVCEAAGISYLTYTGWMKRGKDGEEPFQSFLIDVKKAISDAEVRLVKVIDSASLKEWTAAAWLLERRMPEKFGRRDNVSINDGKPLDVNIHEEKKLLIIAKIESVAGRMALNADVGTIADVAMLSDGDKVSDGDRDEDTTIGTIECSPEDSTVVRGQETGVLQESD